MSGWKHGPCICSGVASGCPLDRCWGSDDPIFLFVIFLSSSCVFTVNDWTNEVFLFYTPEILRKYLHYLIFFFCSVFLNYNYYLASLFLECFHLYMFLNHPRFFAEGRQGVNNLYYLKFLCPLGTSECWSSGSLMDWTRVISETDVAQWCHLPHTTPTLLQEIISHFNNSVLTVF